MSRRERLTDGDHFERSFIWFAQCLGDDADGVDRFTLAAEIVFGRWGTTPDAELTITGTITQPVSASRGLRAPHPAGLRARLERVHRYACLYCGSLGEILVLDHIVPYVRGGPHNESNLAPACEPCNGSKHDSRLHAWLRRRPDLDEASIRERWLDARGDAPLPGLDP